MADLVQAVDEAATNVIRYGYRGEPGEIEMTAELDGDDIVITLEDRAPDVRPAERAAARPVDPTPASEAGRDGHPPDAAREPTRSSIGRARAVATY